MSFLARPQLTLMTHAGQRKGRANPQDRVWLCMQRDKLPDCVFICMWQVYLHPPGVTACSQVCNEYKYECYLIFFEVILAYCYQKKIAIKQLCDVKRSFRFKSTVSSSLYNIEHDGPAFVREVLLLLVLNCGEFPSSFACLGFISMLLSTKLT